MTMKDVPGSCKSSECDSLLLLTVLRCAQPPRFSNQDKSQLVNVLKKTPPEPFHVVQFVKRLTTSSRNLSIQMNDSNSALMP